MSDDFDFPYTNAAVTSATAFLNDVSWVRWLKRIAELGTECAVELCAAAHDLPVCCQQPEHLAASRSRFARVAKLVDLARDVWLDLWSVFSPASDPLEFIGRLLETIGDRVKPAGAVRAAGQSFPYAHVAAWHILDLVGRHVVGASRSPLSDDAVDRAAQQVRLVAADNFWLSYLRTRLEYERVSLSAAARKIADRARREEAAATGSLLSMQDPESPAGATTAAPAPFGPDSPKELKLAYAIRIRMEQPDLLDKAVANKSFLQPHDLSRDATYKSIRDGVQAAARRGRAPG